jgi:hypothetical protein
MTTADELQRRFPVLKKKRSKVALVGFASTSRHLAPYDDDEWEIWALNESHGTPWLRRITRYFQIHQEWDFMKGGNQTYKLHRHWLQQDHPFPIYMQKDFPQVPSCVKYPLDGISEKYLPRVMRGEEVNRYFTSSYSFMMAMALFDGRFDTIGTWGFEMGTDTEFRYQKGSTEFWMGLAAGLGKELYIPEKCQLLSGAIYGWEASRMINRQRLEFYQAQWEDKQKAQMASYHQILGKRQLAEELSAKATSKAEKEAYNLQGRKLFDLEMKQLNATNATFGRVQMCKDLINLVDMMHKGKDPLKGEVPVDDKSAEGDIEYIQTETQIEDKDVVFVEVPDGTKEEEKSEA